MSRRYVGAIERGEVSPTLDRIVRLAVVLRAEPADLLPPLGG
jgi:transcriptional regulator with XRE-family HTH domain